MTSTPNESVPTLRFKDFTESWVTCDLGSLTKIYDGTHQTPKYIKSGVPFYSVEHVTADQFDKTKFISETVFENESKRVNVEKGDILMTRIGSIGVSKYIDWEVRASFYVSLALIKKSNNIDGRYLNSAIQSETFQRELWKRTIHVAFPQKINLGEISHCIIHVPKIEEQQKIAAFLSAVDTRNKQLNRKKSLLTQYKKGMMQKLFSREIRFKDDVGNDYPDWEEKRLGTVFLERSERGEDAGREMISVTLSNGVVKAKDLDRHDNSPADKSKYKKLNVNDIAYNSMRMWQGASGVSRFNGIVSPAYTVLIPQDNQHSIFWGYYFKLKIVLQIFQNNSQGLTSDNWNLKFPALSRIKLQMPIKEEQQKIANFLSAIDRKIEIVTSQLEQAQSFKKGLLQQMFI